MKLEDFLIQEEGDDSRHLPDGRVAATWDRLGHVWNVGPGLTKGITQSTVLTPEELQAKENAEFAATKAAVASLVKVLIGENQRTALESLTYNIGVGGFAHSSVLRDVNAHNFAAVPAAFRMWNKAGGHVVNGLIKRREDEIRLWLHPDDIPPPPDLKTSKNVPQATMEPFMADMTVTPILAPVPAQATAGVNVSTATVVNTLVGNIASAAVTFGAPLLALSQGTTWGHWIMGGLFGLAGLGSFVTNTWSFISHNSAASSNTLQAIGSLTNTANQLLAMAQASAVPAAPANPTPAAS